MAELPESPEALPLRAAYAFLESHGLAEESQTIRASQDRFMSYTSTLKRGRVVKLLHERGLIEEFAIAHWGNGLSEVGKRLTNRYLSIYERFASGAGEEESSEDEATDEETQFAYETDLRDYLAKNLTLLESGLVLWPLAEGTRAVEYPVDERGRRIDILARDASGIPVIIELKVSRGHERTIGQALYYRGRVKQLLKASDARVVIVAREISPELRTASIDLPWVTLFEYRLAMSLAQVGPTPPS